MKTLEIKDVLKKDLLVVELPRVCDYKLTKEMIFIMDKERSTTHRFKGSYTLLGEPDEIREEYATELVQKIEYDFGTCYRHYTDKTAFARTAKESLLSAIGSVIYWENHKTFGDFLYSPKEWEAVERKTFDKSRTLIFVKN